MKQNNKHGIYQSEINQMLCVVNTFSWYRKLDTRFFYKKPLYKQPSFFLASIFLNFPGLESKIILKSSFSVKGVACSGNERNIFRSLSMSLLIITQIKKGPETTNIVWAAQTVIKR